MTTNICVRYCYDSDRYLDGLPKTLYFRKVEFKCKVQLSTWPLLDVPFALCVPMCGSRWHPPGFIPVYVVKLVHSLLKYCFKFQL